MPTPDNQDILHILSHSNIAITWSLIITIGLIATTVGLGLVNVIQPGNVFPEEKQNEYRERFFDDISGRLITRPSLKSFRYSGMNQARRSLLPSSLLFLRSLRGFAHKEAGKLSYGIAKGAGCSLKLPEQ